MSNRIPTSDHPEFRAALLEIAPTPADRERLAKELDVHPKTIQRLLNSLPSQISPLIKEPRLLRALLDSVEKKAA